MFLYYGGFNITNIILLVVYLISGIFGLFVGDIALGDKRRKREEQEKAKAEEMMLEAKRRDEQEIEKITRRQSGPDDTSTGKDFDDDFDFDNYVSDIDRSPSQSTEDEIDDILNEYGSSGSKY